MKINIVLAERSYHEHIIDGKDYGCFTCGNRTFTPELSTEKAYTILHYLDHSAKQYSGFRIGKHYFKRYFVKVSLEFDYIDVFVAVYNAKEVEEHKRAFDDENDITVMI